MKILSILVCAIMILTLFCGCSSKEDFTAHNVEEFKLKLADVLDVSMYEFEEDDDGIEHTLIDEIDYNFDYKVKLGDTEITLPTDYATLKKAGWTSEIAEDFRIDSGVQKGIPFKNSEGREILFYTTCLGAGTENEISCELQSCKLFTLEITLYSSDNTVYVKNENAADFSLTNGITSKSTIKNIVDALGNPTYIEYDMEENEIELCFTKKIVVGYSRLKFQFSASDGFMSRMEYEYSYADI